MTQSGRTLLFFAATALAWPAIATPPLPAADFLRTVALTGTPAPEPDVVISDLRSRVFPILNNSGHTAFEANLRESDQNLDAILTEGGGDGLRVAARTQRTNDGPAFMYSLQA